MSIFEVKIADMTNAFYYIKDTIRCSSKSGFVTALIKFLCLGVKRIKKEGRKSEKAVKPRNTQSTRNRKNPNRQ